MSTRLSIIVTALLALVTAGCITISLFPQAMPLREKTVQGTAADKILMMDISGVISEKGSSNPLSESEDLVARIKEDRKSTRLNSSHSQISYAVFCLKKKKTYK